MDLDQEFRNLAHQAEFAVRETMADYNIGNFEDEDDITGALAGSLRAHLGIQNGPISWNAKVMRHRRGVAAEEARTGADLLIHISLSTPQLRYSKGLLIQAKKNEPNEPMPKGEHKRLLEQCDKMLEITPAAFVFNYSKQGMRCGTALGVKGAGLDLHAACNLTPYRFFYEFFRCTTGDRQIVSNNFHDLRIPHGVEITGRVAAG